MKIPKSVKLSYHIIGAIVCAILFSIGLMFGLIILYYPERFAHVDTTSEAILLAYGYWIMGAMLMAGFCGILDLIINFSFKELYGKDAGGKQSG